MRSTQQSIAALQIREATSACSDCSCFRCARPKSQVLVLQCCSFAYSAVISGTGFAVLLPQLVHLPRLRHLDLSSTSFRSRLLSCSISIACVFQ